MAGTEYDVLDDFGPIGNTGKKNSAVSNATFEGVFLCFHGLNFLNIEVFAPKSCIISLS
jgi:hypothetical protein